MNCSNCGGALAATARFCPTCGTAVATTDAPSTDPPSSDQATGESGTWWNETPTVGADATPPQWSTTTPRQTTDPYPYSATGSQPTATQSTEFPPTSQPVPEAKHTPTNLLRPITFVLAAVGLFAVGFFVYHALSGSDGASSPAAAVNQVTSAVDHQDAVALLGAINPGEVHDLGNVYSSIRNRIEKERVPQGHRSLEGTLFGFDNIKFVNPKFQVTSMGPNVAKVTLVSGSLDFDQKPTTLEVPDNSLVPVNINTLSNTTRHHSYSAADLEYTTHTDSGDHTVEPFVMTVKHSGGWYVSLTYTAAEELVEAEGLQPPDFSSHSSSTPQSTAATPADVFRGIAKAITDKKISEGEGFLSSDEMGAVHDYEGSLQGLIDDNIDPSAAANIQLANISTSTPGGGDSGLVRVDIDSASGSITTSSSDSGSTDTSFNWDGSCLRWTNDNGDGSQCLESRFKQLTGINHIFVDMEHSGGHWTFSPIGTILDYLNTLQHSVPQSIVQRVTGSYNNVTAHPLSMGTLVNGKLNDAGFAVYRFNGNAGDLISVQGDANQGSVEFHVLASNGAEVTSPSEVFKLPTTGQYRLVAVEDGFNTDRIQFRADKVVPQSASLPLDESPNLGAYQTVAYSFDVTDSSTEYTVNGNGDGDYDIVDNSGESTYCSGSCNFDTGHYTAYLFGGSSSGSESLSISQLQFGFDDGSTSESGSLDFDGASDNYTLHAPVGTTVTITVTPDAALDVGLVVDGSTTDSNFQGEAEQTTITTSSDTTDISVESVSGTGSYTLDASQ